MFEINFKGLWIASIKMHQDQHCMILHMIVRNGTYLIKAVI